MTEVKAYLLELNCRRRMAETKGTGGCLWEGKLRRMGPPSWCFSISGISVCAIRLGLRRLEDGRPRDGWRRDGCPWDGWKAEREEDWDECSRDGRCVVVVLFNIVENFIGCYCLIIFDDSNGVCGWVCLGACGRAHGRKSIFSRGI